MLIFTPARGARKPPEQTRNAFTYSAGEVISFQGCVNRAATPKIHTACLKDSRPPETVEISMQGAKALAAVLVVISAAPRNSNVPTTNNGLLILDVSTMGSQMASPKMTTEQDVTSAPTRAKPEKPMGFPTAVPMICAFWLLE